MVVDPCALEKNRYNERLQLRHPMEHSSIIELQKEFFDFSAGHFTVFSENKRENLHGHNYHVQLQLQCKVGNEGLNFDYRHYKMKLRTVLKQLDQTTILATKCPFSQIVEKDNLIWVHFNGEEIPFLKRDVTLLDISNTTVEELSLWVLKQLINDDQDILKHHIDSVEVKVYSNLAQAGSARWNNH
jgi:6-pyruvoyltetrahydropterin/6-carboxytetrahydropterin synthase